MSEINDLKSTVAHLEARLKVAKKELFDASVEGHRFKYGDVLYDKKGRRGEVYDFVRNYGETLALIRRIKKDGSLGVQSIRCYDWDGWKVEVPS